MARISNLNKTKIFDFFQIKDGYIMYELYQKNRKTKSDTRNIIKDAIGIDIFEDDEYKGLSQQKCIEKIINEFSPASVGNLFDSIFEFFKYYNENCKRDCFFCYYRNNCEDVQKIINDLKNSKDEIEKLVSLPKLDSDIDDLYSDLDNDLKNKQFSLALDRLHTYSLDYLGHLCANHKIVPKKDKKGHIMFDDMLTQLSDYYEKYNIIDEFGKSVIRVNKEVFQKYNSVRNNQSFAHPNKVMENNDARFVVEVVLVILRYIDNIEKNSASIFLSDELPF